MAKKLMASQNESHLVPGIDMDSFVAAAARNLTLDLPAIANLFDQSDEKNCIESFFGEFVQLVDENDPRLLSVTGENYQDYKETHDADGHIKEGMEVPQSVDAHEQNPVKVDEEQGIILEPGDDEAESQTGNTERDSHRKSMPEGVDI